jgi:hypothetical protein
MHRRPFALVQDMDVSTLEQIKRHEDKPNASWMFARAVVPTQIALREIVVRKWRRIAYRRGTLVVEPLAANECGGVRSRTCGTK